MMYVSQIITLYILNLYSTICQLYLNTTVRKKLKKNKRKHRQYTMFDTGLHIFLDMLPQVRETKEKKSTSPQKKPKQKNQMGLHQIKKAFD